MRILAFLLTVACAAAPAALAQSGVRTGGPAQSGPGRIASPLPPTPGVTTARPAAPDARLGAGGIRPNTGNIIYPGTPGPARPGNILTPGTPAAQPIPAIVQPPRSQVYEVGDDAPRRGRGHGRRFGGEYPVYGFFPYVVPNVIAVGGGTMTRSSSGYVVTVGGDEPAEAPAQAAETADPGYWLLALRGGLIYAVSDYAIEARAVRFLTLQGDEYVVPLAELDRELTLKLNHDLGVSIDLETR